MVSIGSSLQQSLLDDSIVFALTHNRILTSQLRQNDPLPAIVYQQISGSREHSLTGQSGLARVVIQYDCLAETKREVDDLAEAIRLVFYSLSGSVNGINIGGILFNGEWEFYESEIRVYRKSLDFEISFQESTG